MARDVVAELLGLLAEMKEAVTNGEAADVHERIGILLEESGADLLAVVTAATELRDHFQRNDMSGLDRETSYYLAEVVNSLARLYASSETSETPTTERGDT